MPTALITCATDYVGAPAIAALMQAGFDVYAHAAAFTDAKLRATFEAAHKGIRTSIAPSMAEFAAEAVAAFGQIDVCVMNSAYAAERMAVDKIDDAKMRAAYEALVFGPLMLAQAVAPHMKERKSGKLIFCTSAAPLRGIANYSVYVSARGAVNAAVKSLALELGPHNIQVNAVAPNFLESETYFPKSLMADPVASAKILSNIPMGRLGKPEEAGALIAYLSSRQADFVTGQVIALSGGWA